jgi:valyl-tRNA synthetase
MTQQVKNVNAPQPSASGAYNPKDVEARWTEFWFQNSLFETLIEPDRPNFSCALPPPNITGNLHMGHALNGTLQDVLTRWHRMQGYNVLWQPGTDHAGISTQMVVERELKKQGISRHDLGREKFIEKCWEWRDLYGNNILNQYKRLGVSFAWDRIKFTMDADYTKAIYRVFVTLFKEGQIYRGNRVTNWCPRCLTSLSDLEVEHDETKGGLYHIKYPFADGATVNGLDGLIVATTRPESMFGDVAVAVNPKDPRYEGIVGKEVVLPLTDRRIPVIGDEYVDTEFGTGALKVTPAHDVNDWEIGQRHKLAMPQVIDKHGKLIDNEFVPKQFQGMERFAARKAAVAELEEKGFLLEVRDYTVALGFCERCHTAIEPYLSDQWYLSMTELAKPAIQVVEEQRVQFIPERYAATYLDWMRNIRDWNISRQLWWGHRIPVWTCKKCQHVDAYEEEPTACTKCGGTELEQDPDVLDTWFSSALWPFATLGWPEQTTELKTFYPTNILSTAREIINLWVARMIFDGVKFAGAIPFKHVLIHPVIQTADGKRMSKSKGNAIDPIDMIEKYGADANRFWFTAVGVKGDQDVRFREDRLEEYKRFVNKLWNAGKLVLDKIGPDYKPQPIDLSKATLADKWILHRYTQLLKGLQSQLTNYDFTEAATALYEFMWDYFCDWYLEIAKLELAKESSDSQARHVLFYVFEGVMRALHPIMPFFTEEVWQKLPRHSFLEDMDSIMFAPYPRPNEEYADDKAEAQFDLLMRTIRGIRNIRQTFGVDKKANAEVVIYDANDAERATIEGNADIIRALATVEPLTIKDKGEKPPMSAESVVSNATVYVLLGQLIDVEKTRKKLTEQRNAVVKEVDKLKGTLDNPDFRKRAPADKVAAQEASLAEAQAKLEAFDAQMALLDSMVG